MRLGSLAVCVVSVVAAVSAQAAELGALTVLSQFNEPFHAKLDVKRANVNETVLVRLSSDAMYEKVGAKRVFGANDLTLRLESGEQAILWIHGKRPVKVQNFSLIFEATSEIKSGAKHYRVQMPMAIPSAHEVKKEPQAPIVHREKSAYGTVSEMERKAIAASAAKTASKQAKKPVAKTVAQKRPARVPVSQLKPVQLPLNAADYDIRRPFLVRPGMTGWSVARLYRNLFPKASVEQVLVALVRANPDEFEGGRITGITPGTWLLAPTASAVAAVDPQFAKKAVHTPSPLGLLGVQSETKSTPLEKKTVKPQEKPLVKAQSKSEVKPVQKVAEPSNSESKPVLKKAASAKPIVKTPENNGKLPKSKSDGKQINEKSSSQITPLEDNSPKLVKSFVRRHIAEPVSKIETGFKTSGALFWGLVSVLLGIISAGLWWYVRRREQSEDREEPVMFLRHHRNTTDEQIEGIDRMVSNRLQADAASQRGFSKPASFEPKREASSESSVADGSVSMIDREPTLTRTDSPELEMLEMVKNADALAKETGIGHAEPSLSEAKSLVVPALNIHPTEPQVSIPANPVLNQPEDHQEPGFAEPVANAAADLLRGESESDLFKAPQPSLKPQA